MKLLVSFIKVVIPLGIVVYSFSFGLYIGLTFAAVYAALVLLKFRVGLYTVLASMNYSKGKKDKALIMFKNLYKKKGVNIDTKLTYAYILLKEGYPDESAGVLDDIESICLKEKRETTFKSTKALVMWKQGDIEGAIDLLYELHHKEKSTTIYGSLGWLLVLKGDLEKALEINLEAYDYNNKNQVIMDNLGYTYYLMGNVDKAGEIYKSLVDSTPYFPEPYYNYGIILEAAGDDQKALEYYKKAADMDFTYLSTVSKSEVLEKINSLNCKN